MRWEPLEPALIVRVQRGERQALDIFFGYHLPLLSKWAATRVPRWLESEVDADDLVQLAAIRTLRRLHHLSPERAGSIQAYMRQTVLNLLRDAARRAGRVPERVAIEDCHAADDDSAFDIIAARRSTRAYAQAKRRLSRRDRDAITGRVERGLDYEALTTVLRVPSANAARVAVTRAVARLVKEMCSQPGVLPDAVCSLSASASLRAIRRSTTEARKRRGRVSKIEK
jgi:RNA polymerase sigma factor (sigma-70 family)